MILFKHILVFLVIFFNISWSWPDSISSNNKQANKLYKEGKIDEALSKWREAQIENPDNDKLHYNIANGLHEQKKYEDAFNEYEKTLDSKDSELQKNVYYNMGNTHYRMGKLEEAIDSYKKCLDIDSDDEDAKYNIEFVRKKIRENLQKQEQQQQAQQKEKEEEKRPSLAAARDRETREQKLKGQQKLEETEEKKELQEGEDKGIEKEKIGEDKPGGSGKAGEEKKEEMSKEDALRLLDALKDDEKDLQKELRNQPIEGEHRVDKDW